MKNIIIALLFSIQLSAQTLFECGTVEPPNTLIISSQMSDKLAADQTIRTIPLVFHIVHNPTLFPNDSALAATKITTYIDIAQKFLRKQNADTSQTVPAFRSVMADAHIEFCLKQVIYKRTTEASFTTDDKIKFTPTGSPAVNPNLHLNVWLGRLTGSLGGYAYFPSSGSVGQPFDGVVTLLSPNHSDEAIAEIIVHEIGHYLGLYHCFQSGSCTSAGDFCDDTPPTDSPSPCNLSITHCGQLTQVQNVMDYAHCATGLTKDQIARMNATLIGLRNALWNSGTCGSPGNPPPSVSITFPTNNQVFTFPANINIQATATDNGSITKVEFYQGSTLLSTDLTFPYSFNWTNIQIGTYNITAKAFDNGGASAMSSVIRVVVGSSTNIPPTCVNSALVSRFIAIPLLEKLQLEIRLP